MIFSPVKLGNSMIIKLYQYNSCVIIIKNNISINCILYVGILKTLTYVKSYLSNTLIREVTPLTLHGQWVFFHWSRMPLGQHHTLPKVPLVMVDHSGLLHAKDNFLSPKKTNNIRKNHLNNLKTKIKGNWT